MASAAHGERLQREELALHEVSEEQRGLQAELAERERDARHMKARQEQLQRIFQEPRAYRCALRGLEIGK